MGCFGMAILFLDEYREYIEFPLLCAILQFQYWVGFFLLYLAEDSYM